MGMMAPFSLRDPHGLILGGRRGKTFRPMRLLSDDASGIQAGSRTKIHVELRPAQSYACGRFVETNRSPGGNYGVEKISNYQIFDDAIAKRHECFSYFT